MVRRNPGQVFTPFDFLDLGSPHSVGMVLTRMMRSGNVRRLARGLYDVPRTDAVLGALLPTAEELARALARRNGATVHPAGGMAANLLGLSDQVQARAIYLTDGPSRAVKVGALTVQLKKRPPREGSTVSPMSSVVFAALRNLGKLHVNKPRVERLTRVLSLKDRRRLLKDLPLAPAWMHPYLRFIARELG